MAVDPTRIAGDPQLRVAGMRVHTLFEQHSRMVYGLCRALLRDPHDAEDATQASFVSAYTALLGGTSPREPAAWLATIARNECAGRARARMREPLPLLDAEIADMQGPEAELERKASVTELRQAIADLPEKQREAVVLRDLYGLHYTEVGAALGMSVASVESLLFRARRRLRVSLKPLASGALTVPVAVQEGVAQAIPSFAGAGAAGGGATSGAIGIGLLTKLFAGPAGIKVAVGVAGAVAAGSIAVAGVDHADRVRPHASPVSRPASAGPLAAAPRAAVEAAFVGVPVPPAGNESSAGEDDTPDRSGDRGARGGSGSHDGSAESHASGGKGSNESRSGDDGHRQDGGTAAASGDDRSGRESGTSSSSGDDRPGHDSGSTASGPSGSSGGKGENDVLHVSGASAAEHGGDDVVTSTSGETSGGAHSGDSSGGETGSGDSGHGGDPGHGGESGHGGDGHGEVTPVG